MKATGRWPQQLQWGGNWLEAYKVNSTAKENRSCRDDGRWSETWLRGDLVSMWIRGPEPMQRTKAQESTPGTHKELVSQCRWLWHTESLKGTCTWQHKCWVLKFSYQHSWQTSTWKNNILFLHRTPTSNHEQTAWRQWSETIPRDAVGRWWVVGVHPWMECISVNGDVSIWT